MPNTIHVERDDEQGYHAVLFGTGDTVLFITDSFTTEFAAVDAALDYLTQRKDQHTMKPLPDDQRRKAPTSNESAPRFVALVSEDFVEADDDLDVLIALVRHDGIGSGEDCVIWDHFHHVAAVVRYDGEVVRFDPPKLLPEKSPTAKNGVDERLRAIFLKRKGKKS